MSYEPQPAVPRDPKQSLTILLSKPSVAQLQRLYLSGFAANVTKPPTIFGNLDGEKLPASPGNVELLFSLIAFYWRLNPSS